MAEEFFRSFHKSLLKNLLLMVMFSISLVMTVIMGSYYFGLGERHHESTQQVRDRTWCPLDLMTENDSEIEESLMTATGCQNMMEYYETLRSSKDCPIISVEIPNIIMKEEDVKRFFGDRSYFNFQLETRREAYMADFGDEGVCSLLDMKGARIDLGAYRYFGLGIQEGEGFTEQNLRLECWSDPIPVLLGSDYKGIMKPGESAEETVAREVKEEIGVDVKSVTYIKSYPFEKKEMLMLGFKATASKAEFKLSGEVDSAQWVKFEDALPFLKAGSIAWQLVDAVIHGETEKGAAQWNNLASSF